MLAIICWYFIRMLKTKSLYGFYVTLDIGSPPTLRATLVIRIGILIGAEHGVKYKVRIKSDGYGSIGGRFE